MPSLANLAPAALGLFLGTALAATVSCDNSDDCTAGTEGCACNEGHCVGELECLSEACVDPFANPGDDGADEGDDGNSDEGGDDGEPQTCDPNEPLSIVGTLETDVASVKFDRVSAEVHHKRDIDEFEDRCVNQVRLTFRSGDGCRLTVVADGFFTPQARLRIRDAEFEADSQCPNFPDVSEGFYRAGSDGLIEDGSGIEGVLMVADRNSQRSCFAGDYTVHLAGPMHADNDILMINPTQIRINGYFLSEALDLACPTFLPGG